MITILELKVHIESKLNLIQSLKKEDWIKSMCIKHILYQQLHDFMFVIHDTLQKENKYNSK
jgi:hypothetical protein